MSTIKIQLKVNQLTDSKVKLKLEINSGVTKSKPAANQVSEARPETNRHWADESLTLFDCPPEPRLPSAEPLPFWRNIFSWFKLWQHN